VCSNTVEVNNNKKSYQTNKQTKQAKIQKQKFQKLSVEKSHSCVYFTEQLFLFVLEVIKITCVLVIVI
jgi:hypothetical protein